MNFIKILPILFSALLLTAHFLRAGFLPLILLSLLFPIVLFFKRPWAARTVQVVLVLGAMEWIRTALILVAERREDGQAWTRLVIILGTVALFTGCSAVLFCCRSLKARYQLGDTD